MVSIFPVLLVNAAGTMQCIHGGVFKPAVGSTTTTIDGDPPAITKEGLLTVVTPCNGIPPTIPPCVFAQPAQSMVTRVTIDTVAFKPVNVMMPQLAASNAMPSFVPKTKSTSTLVI